MKKIITALCLIPSLIWGVTFESNRMEDALPYVGKETWVLIDVDNTLIESSVHLGSAQWRSHIRKKVQDAGYNALECEAILDRFWLFVQPFIPVRLVDPKAPVFIQNIQMAKIPVLALTAREPIELAHTQKQLDSVGVNLINDFPESFSLPSAYPGSYERGVIYCGENAKEEALVAFFQEAGLTPKKVIFIDDRWDQVIKLEVELEKLGIEFVGIRFSGADQRVKAFDPAVADLQFSRLPQVVSDEEAIKILSK
jgi:FMN phosphatase YigB (HAD superfamily)